MRRTTCLLALIPLTAVGCARMSATTELKPDGTITRRLEFHAPAPDNPQGLSMGPKAEDIFAFPGAPAWTVTRTKKDQDLIVKAERTMKASDSLPSDVKIKGAKGVALITNSLSVKQVSPGRWEYRETLHWNGPRPAEMSKVPEEVKGAFKESLPAALATPENLQSLGELTFKEFWRALFGPGDPLFSMLMLHPDLAERKVIRRIGQAVNAALVEKFSDKLSQAQRGTIVKRIVQRAMEDTKTSTKAKADPQAGGQENNPSGLTALLFTVKLPGSIVSTNGERDDVTGEVYWALYGEAAAVGDVTMTAVCEVK